MAALTDSNLAVFYSSAALVGGGGERAFAPVGAYQSRSVLYCAEYLEETEEHILAVTSEKDIPITVRKLDKGGRAVSDHTAFKIVNKDIERYICPITMSKIPTREFLFCGGNRSGVVLDLNKGNFFYVDRIFDKRAVLLSSAASSFGANHYFGYSIAVGDSKGKIWLIDPMEKSC